MSKIRIEPSGQEAEVTPSGTLLHTALDHGLAIPFGCQSARCGVCRVRVFSGSEGGLRPPTVVEQATLEAFRCPPDVRLACQAYIVGDVIVETLAQDLEDTD